MYDPSNIEDDNVSSAGSANSIQIWLIDTNEEEIIPTINAINNNVNIQAQTVYSGKVDDFVILGNDLLCLCKTTSLLTRKRH